MTTFARLCFGETDVSNLRMGEGDCWHEIVARPAFVGRTGTFVMVVGEDVCFVVRFVAKLLTPVDIAKGVDAIDARFEKLVRADPAAVVQRDLRVFQAEPVCRWHNAGTDEEVFGVDLFQCASCTIFYRQHNAVIFLAHSWRFFVEVEGDAVGLEILPTRCRAVFVRFRQ